MGDPTPIESYGARDLGARRFDIIDGTSDCNGAKGGGNRIISGSANRLYKNPSTSSPVSGPPKFSNRTPTFGSCMSDDMVISFSLSLLLVEDDDDGHGSDIESPPPPRLRPVATDNCVDESDEHGA